MPIDKKFWDGTRWNGHAAFRTNSHIHVCLYPAEKPSCDIMAVGCEDGRWYVEDNWGDEAPGAARVWNPFDACDAGPFFFDSQDAAVRHAVGVVAEVCGVDPQELLSHYL